MDIFSINAPNLKNELCFKYFYNIYIIKEAFSLVETRAYTMIQLSAAKKRGNISDPRCFCVISNLYNN